MQQISLAITTYNRFDLTIKSFEKVIGDERISDIVIVDDASTNGDGDRLKECFKDNPKVTVVINGSNVGMALNKMLAIGYSENQFTIILDSDNFINSEYLDAIKAIGELKQDTIYMPEFARPNFDFRKFAGQLINKQNVKEFVSDPMGNTCINACNYVVNRDFYLETFATKGTIKETDTAYFFYLWMKAGYNFQIVKDMQYDHLVHDGSAWLANAAYNMKMGEEIRNKILAL
jgi:glycosyltransferase involved in cell wall biosynthesis